MAQLEDDDNKKQDLVPKVIFVVTNHTKWPKKKKEKIGWYLPEVAHPYYILIQAGIQVVFASPRGGGAEADPESVKNYEKDEKCIKFTKEKLDKDNKLETYAISALNHKDYQAIFFAGGHGTMFDFPDDKFLQQAAVTIYENDGIVSAVCHGPAALVNIKLSDGEYLVKDKNVTGFTNSEEKVAKVDDLVPFSLEDELVKKGGKFKGAQDWSCNVIVDGRLITGQNPSSAGAVAEAIIKLLKK